jgi:hypothetical protein
VLTPGLTIVLGSVSVMGQFFGLSGVTRTHAASAASNAVRYLLDEDESTGCWA